MGDDQETAGQQVDAENVHVQDRLRTPLQLHGYTPIQAVENEKPVNNMLLDKTNQLTRG